MLLLLLILLLLLSVGERQPW